jgi:hypothetical protein
MFSSGLVDHSRTIKFQTCYVHKLGTLKSFQTTILCITKNLKLLFIWFHLHWFGFTKTHHLRTLIATFSHNISGVKLKSHLHACIHLYDCHMWIYVFMFVSLSCLDCEEELNYPCECCECASCCQGKWHTSFSTYFYYCISNFSSMHDRWNINCFTKCLDPSSV